MRATPLSGVVVSLFDHGHQWYLRSLSSPQTAQFWHPLWDVTQRWPSPRVQWQNHRYAYPNQDLQRRCSERWRSGANQIVKPQRKKKTPPVVLCSSDSSIFFGDHEQKRPANHGETSMNFPFWRPASSGKSAFASSFKKERRSDHGRGWIPHDTTIFGRWVTPTNPNEMGIVKKLAMKNGHLKQYQPTKTWHLH